VDFWSSAPEYCTGGHAENDGQDLLRPNVEKAAEWIAEDYTGYGAEATALSEAAPMSRKLSLRASRCRTKTIKAQAPAAATAAASRHVTAMLSAVDRGRDRNTIHGGAKKRLCAISKSRAFFSAQAFPADSA
jgi:hypothetical protein